MSIVSKYEAQYREGRGVCGAPFPEIVGFFEAYDRERVRILDLGCGQGRDALLVARYGHHVVGVDSSQTGIRQMLEDAKAEGLSVEGIVADLTAYVIEGSFDIIMLDRVLHMLEEERRLSLLKQAVQHVDPDGFILIADMPSNKPAFLAALSEDRLKWKAVLDQRGFLFMRLEP